MKQTILFPSGFFDVCRVDEDMEAEYEAVAATGLYHVVLYEYEQWFHEGRLVLHNKPSYPVEAVYRGWMMKPEQYRHFFDALRQQDISLVTSPEAYELLHIFPRIYPLIRKDTAPILVYPEGTQPDLKEIKTHFCRFMVKDYVKSVKGTAFPAFFSRDITQEEFDRWMKLFYQYRGELFTGGICVKEYLSLRRYGGKINEYRVYYVKGEILSVSRNAGQGGWTPEPPQKLLEKYKNLDSPFYTIDYAELENGIWMILETGDGSVSGLSEGQSGEAFFRALQKGLAAEKRDADRSLLP